MMESHPDVPEDTIERLSDLIEEHAHAFTAFMREIRLYMEDLTDEG
jgi:hypothetical protein